MKKLLTAGAFALTFATPALAEIEIHDPYARAATPNAKAGAAFMVIHNHGGPNDRLISVSSDIAARTELHTHVENNQGVMRMMEVTEGFDLPTDGEIIMERGGYHVMFMGLNQSLNQGDTVEVTLTFEQAGDVVVTVPVDLERKGGHSHGGHNH